MSPAAESVSSARHTVLQGPFHLEAGGRVERITVAYETWGELAATGDNAVLVCHALTGNSHVAGDCDDPGWWDGVVGPGRALDPARHFIVCANLLGSCSGTTGPSSPEPGTGRLWGMRFPVVTPRDMVAVQKALLDRLGVRRLAAGRRRLPGRDAGLAVAGRPPGDGRGRGADRLGAAHLGVGDRTERGRPTCDLRRPGLAGRRVLRRRPDGRARALPARSR